MLEPKREEVECQNVRRHVASDCYILTREEVGLNKSDNEGLREVNSAFQIFSFVSIPFVYLQRWGAHSQRRQPGHWHLSKCLLQHGFSSIDSHM